MAVGTDGLFMEVHEDPDQAKSDGPNQLVMETLPALLWSLKRIWEATR
jgi:2-dehydro-3-deoxyphosphooctonate aldolase (KDO 8-P synthase)